MSIRISVEWTNMQKFLKILEGTLSVIYCDFKNTPTHKILYKCYVTIKEGSISYSAIDRESGIPTILSHLLHEQTQSLLRAYYKGFLLEDQIYSWIDSSQGFLPHEWAVKQYESLSEDNKRNFEISCFTNRRENCWETEEMVKTKIIESIKRLDY